MANTTTATFDLHASTPALQLHPDLLWRIFTINANMFSGDDSLKTTRYTSQVCTVWREFMLESPSLWGRLIDLDDVKGKSQDWMEEVFRRSGTSPLWIKWEASEPVMPTTTNFLFSLLSDHWERIQRLVVSPRMEKHPNFWNMFYLPSPQLQVFRLSTHGQHRFASSPLFANNAPSLQQFEAKYLDFNLLESHWLSGLRSVHLGPPFTANEVFSALEMMPFLQELHIYALSEPQVFEHDLAFPSLPHLIYLELFQVNFWTGLIFLDHIHAPRTCSLTMKTRPINTNLGDEISFKTLLQPLSKFTQNFIRSHAPKKIYVRYYPTHLHFQFQGGGNDTEMEFNILIRYRPNTLPTYMFNHMFAAFHSLEILTVTDAKWMLHYTLPDVAFIPFLPLLPSVATIEINQPIIDLLARLQADIPGLIFPCLRIIKLDEYQISNLGAALASLLPLLRFRNEAGCRLEALDLKCTQDTFQELLLLDETLCTQVHWTPSLELGSVDGNEG